MAFHAARNSLATLVIHPNGHPYDSDLLDVGPQDRVVAFYPKPRPAGVDHRNLVNAGLYVLSPRLLDDVAVGQFADLGRDIFPRLVQSGGLYGYNTPEYIVDVGTVERLRKVEADVISGKVARLNRADPRRALFLDRDGVLNVEKDHVRSPDEMQLLPGVADAVKRINASEFLAVVVTNQPAIAKGFDHGSGTWPFMRDWKRYSGGRAYLDRIYYCPHHPEKGFPGERPEYKMDCECRKPKPGMLLAAAKELHIDLAVSFVVGDRTADVQAGRVAGCKTILCAAATPARMASTSINPISSATTLPTRCGWQRLAMSPRPPEAVDARKVESNPKHFAHRPKKNHDCHTRAVSDQFRGRRERPPQFLQPAARMRGQHQHQQVHVHLDPPLLRSADPGQVFPHGTGQQHCPHPTSNRAGGAGEFPSRRGRYQFDRRRSGGHRPGIVMFLHRRAAQRTLRLRWQVRLEGNVGPRSLRNEIDILKDPIGKQDQYAAAYGGLNLITFYPDEAVHVSPIVMPAGSRRLLADNLLMFYLGGTRSAAQILAEQDMNITATPRSSPASCE